MYHALSRIHCRRALQPESDVGVALDWGIGSHRLAASTNVTPQQRGVHAEP